MAKQNETRIIITRGKRVDLKAEITIWEPASNKLISNGLTAGPSNADIDRTVRTMKMQLERAGNFVTFCER